MYCKDRFSITNRTYNEEGYLVVGNNRLARTGILEYRYRDIPFMVGNPKLEPFDVVRVYRGEADLFDEEVLKTFSAKPITLEHPEELLNSKNVKYQAVGFSKDDVHQEDEFMVATLVITDEEAIKAVNEGTKELSLGYTADIIWQPGVDKNGNPYDAVQRNIKGNHIAVTVKGRCGSDCAISDSNNNNKRGINMPEIIIGGISYECPAQTAQAVKQALAIKDSEIENLTKEKGELKDELEEVKKQEDEEDEEDKKTMDSLRAENDQLKANQVKDSDLDVLITQRMNLIEDAKTVLPSFDHTGLSNKEIISKVVKDSCSGISDSDMQNPVYVKARFDALVSQTKGSGIMKVLKDHAGNGGTVSDGLSLSERKRMEKIQENKKKRGV